MIFPDPHVTDAGPEKADAASCSTTLNDADDHSGGGRRCCSLLVSAWSVVLVDPNIGPLVLLALGAFGMTLGVMGAAMGLGLLDFGLFAAGDRIIGWFRRGSTWPDS